MALSPAELSDRFRACLLGFAVGDALGFPLRGVPPQGLTRMPSLAEDFAPRPRGKFAKGQFTDDTQLLLAVVESLVRERKVDGRSVAAHVASLWHEGIILQPPLSLTEVAQRLLRGTPWMSAGAPLGARDPSVLSRGVVLGLWDHRRLEVLGHDAGVLAVVTHRDPMCAAAVAAFARAVSFGVAGEPFTTGLFCDELAAAASTHDLAFAQELRHLPRVLAWDEGRALEILRRVGVPAAQLKDSEGLPAHVSPVLLTALYAVLKVPHDFRRAVSLVLRCGGELDVAAAVCGALMGAHLGTEAIPARLRRNVLYSSHLVEAAERLLAALLEAEAARVAPVRASAPRSWRST